MKLKISRVTARAAVAAKALRPHAIDLAGLGGLAAFVHGLHLVYPPAAWIVGGLALFAIASVFSRKKA